MKLTLTDVDDAQAIELTLTNDGDRISGLGIDVSAPDAVTFLSATVDASGEWAGKRSALFVLDPIESGGSVTARIQYSIPATGAYRIAAYAETADGRQATATTTVGVDGGEPVGATPGGEAELAFTWPGHPESVSLSLSKSPGWPVTNARATADGVEVPEFRPIEPGSMWAIGGIDADDELTVTMTFSVPDDASPGRYAFDAVYAADGDVHLDRRAIVIGDDGGGNSPTDDT